MKKQILNIGTALNKAEQKKVQGGMFRDPCPCTASYTTHPDGSCSYPALFPQGFVCLGEVQNGLCCES